MSTMCNICCEKYTKISRKPIVCPYCNISCCVICVKKYLTGDGIGDEPHCMSCNKEWTMEFLSEYTPRVFHNVEYRNHRINVLFQREKSLLPASQADAERELELNECEKKMNEVITRLENTKDIYYAEIKQINQAIRQEREIYHRHRGDILHSEPVERAKFVQACPGDGCNGFLSSSWKCGLCKVWVCKECRCIKAGKDDPEHTCDPDMVKTAEMIAKETKNCPKCAVPIFKISGCQQMWCTSCHTPFDWKTGKIVQGNIHNPHYFEWQRINNNGHVRRQPGDELCGGIINGNHIGGYLRHIRHIRKRNNGEDVKHSISEFHSICRLIQHIADVEYRNYPIHIGVDDNSKLRVKYLLKKIDEHEWKDILKRKQKKHEKDHAIHQVLEMFVGAGSDIIQNIFNLTTSIEIDNMIEELYKLREYTNCSLQTIGNRFNNTVPNISNEWNIVRV